jgi:hypothetical protein
MPHLLPYFPEPMERRRLLADPENEPNFSEIACLFYLPGDRRLLVQEARNRLQRRGIQIWDTVFESVVTARRNGGRSVDTWYDPDFSSAQQWRPHQSVFFLPWFCCDVPVAFIIRTQQPLPASATVPKFVGAPERSEYSRRNEKRLKAANKQTPIQYHTHHSGNEQR